MPGQNPDFTQAMTLSYPSQKNGVTIPLDHLGEIVIIPLGFQPLGIGAVEDKIAVAAYFEPAVCTFEADWTRDGLVLEGSWIRGVYHGLDSVRIFPDAPKFSDMNRGQACCWLPDGRLAVTRNGEREIFIIAPPHSIEARDLGELHILPAPKRDPNKWELVARGKLEGDEAWMIQGLHYDDFSTSLWVVEADRASAASICRLASYLEGKLSTTEAWDISFLYGGALNPKGPPAPYVITDYRSNHPKGIYRSDDMGKPVVPDVWGTGICFLSNGAALVSRYGQGEPGFFNGAPGALIYIPASRFGY